MITQIPEYWANGQMITNEDRLKMYLLRIAGCKCGLPLLGDHAITLRGHVLWLPRCRLCNTEFIS